MVGRGTAGGYGHHLKKSIMLGYVRTDVATVGRDDYALEMSRRFEQE